MGNPMTEPTTKVTVNNPSASMAFRRILTRSIIYPVVLLVILIMIFLWQLSSVVRTNQRVEHNNIVIGQVSVILKLLADMESGLRGYLLTNDSEFLQPYQQAQTTFDAS